MCIRKICVASVLLGICTPAHAGVNLDIHIGTPAPVVVAPAVSAPVYQAPEPAPVPEPVYPVAQEPAPTVVIEQAPQLIFSPILGFYVAVGAPYDMVYVNNLYYVHRNGVWLASPNVRGPWLETPAYRLPYGLKRYNVERIRFYRDKEYSVYRRDPANYHGRFLNHEPINRAEIHRPVDPSDHRFEQRPIQYNARQNNPYAERYPVQHNVQQVAPGEHRFEQRPTQYNASQNNPYVQRYPGQYNVHQVQHTVPNQGSRPVVNPGRIANRGTPGKIANQGNRPTGNPGTVNRASNFKKGPEPKASKPKTVANTPESNGQGKESRHK